MGINLEFDQGRSFIRTHVDHQMRCGRNTCSEHVNKSQRHQEESGKEAELLQLGHASGLLLYTLVDTDAR